MPSVCGFPRLSTSTAWVTFSSQSHLTTRGQFDRKVIAELFQFCPLWRELCSGTNLVIEAVPEIHYQILHLVIWFVITSGGEGISILLSFFIPHAKKRNPVFVGYIHVFIVTFTFPHILTVSSLPKSLLQLDIINKYFLKLLESVIKLILKLHFNCEVLCILTPSIKRISTRF